MILPAEWEPCWCFFWLSINFMVCLRSITSTKNMRTPLDHGVFHKSWLTRDGTGWIEGRKEKNERSFLQLQLASTAVSDKNMYRDRVTPRKGECNVIIQSLTCTYNLIYVMRSSLFLTIFSVGHSGWRHNWKSFTQTHCGWLKQRREKMAKILRQTDRQTCWECSMINSFIDWLTEAEIVSTSTRKSSAGAVIHMYM